LGATSHWNASPSPLCAFRGIDDACLASARANVTTLSLAAPVASPVPERLHSHFPMADLNNKEIAALLEAWLHQHGLDKE
jgi:hypothetical protein